MPGITTRQGGQTGSVGNAGSDEHGIFGNSEDRVYEDAAMVSHGLLNMDAKTGVADPMTTGTQTHVSFARTTVRLAGSCEAMPPACIGYRSATRFFADSRGGMPVANDYLSDF